MGISEENQHTQDTSAKRRISAIVEAAHNYKYCIDWCFSHWLSAVDLESLRRQSAIAGDGRVRELADKCESYERQRDRAWIDARRSGYALLGIAREWKMESDALAKILTSFHSEYLPCICGVDPKTCIPPDFESAKEEAATICTEAEIRLAMLETGIEEDPVSKPISIVPEPQSDLDKTAASQDQHLPVNSDKSIIGAPEITPTHSDDYTFVNWFGTEYTFALGVQSSAVRTLWNQWDKNGLGLHQDTIRNSIDAERDSFRMDSTFRGHPAFGPMIQRCGDGKYRLASPNAVTVASMYKKKKSAKGAPESRQKRR
jgi:hypothetical protein